MSTSRTWAEAANPHVKGYILSARICCRRFPSPGVGVIDVAFAHSSPERPPKGLFALERRDQHCAVAAAVPDSGAVPQSTAPSRHPRQRDLRKRQLRVGQVRSTTLRRWPD